MGEGPPTCARMRRCALRTSSPKAVRLENMPPKSCRSRSEAAPAETAHRSSTYAWCVCLVACACAWWHVRVPGGVCVCPVGVGCAWWVLGVPGGTRL